MSSCASSIPNRGVFVDVGESSLFFTQVDGAVEYRPIYSSHKTSAYMVTMDDYDTVLLKVTWSKFKRVAQSKGDAGMEICSHLHYVPDVYAQELHMLNSTYVSVTVRQYMYGMPLSYIWADLPLKVRQKIMEDIDCVVDDIARHTCAEFMSLQGKNLSTPSPVMHLNYRILISMMTNRLKKGDMRTIECPEFEATPVLCHGQLTMDHVIVSNGEITGIVGWSQCDYVPEILDRLRYEFAKPQYSGDSEWLTSLAHLDLYYPPPPPMYIIPCVYYNYNLRLRVTPPELKHGADRTLGEVFQRLIRSSSTDTDASSDEGAPHGRDQWSHVEHSEAGVMPLFCDLVASSPSRDCSGTIAPSDGRTVDTWEDWDDKNTVAEILDILSVKAE